MIPFQYMMFLENDSNILATQWIDFKLLDGSGMMIKIRLN